MTQSSNYKVTPQPQPVESRSHKNIEKKNRNIEKKNRARLNIVKNIMTKQMHHVCELCPGLHNDDGNLDNNNNNNNNKNLIKKMNKVTIIIIIVVDDLPFIVLSMVQIMAVSISILTVVLAKVLIYWFIM